MASPAAKSAYLGWVAAAIAGERGASPTFAAGEHDLILGYATGYDAADVAIFVRSLRAVYDGAVVLVTDQKRELLAFLAEHGVESVAPLSAGNGAWRPHPVMQRFAAFDALMSERPWARNVLLTDVRDVVFQAPPFDPPPQTPEFYVEYDGGLSGHAFNMKYLRGVGGEDVARALADKPCVCVGTVVGPRESMIRFCRTLLMLAVTVVVTGLSAVILPRLLGKADFRFDVSSVLSGLTLHESLPSLAMSEIPISIATEAPAVTAPPQTVAAVKPAATPLPRWRTASRSASSTWILPSPDTVRPTSRI